MKKPSTENVEFFAVAQPGLEDLVESELREWLPGIGLQREHGGVTFLRPLAQGLSLNRVLKTPTRLLVRVDRFRCRDFPKLFKTISALDWNRWLQPDCTLSVQASTRVSRLKIKKRIEETSLEAWSAYQRQQGVRANPKKTAELYVRFADDICTLSLDTSGERLHKRGERQLIGEAPLRESIAAALIQWVARDFSLGEADIEIVDPMMGSGTFLIEAGTRDREVESREFAFDHFAGGVPAAPQSLKGKNRIVALRGIESDPKTFQAAEANLRAAGSFMTLDLRKGDLFGMTAVKKATGVQRWLFANPPYGERLKIEGPLMAFYERVFAASEKVFQPDRAIFLLPAKAVKGKFVLPPGWKVLAKRPFLNGGIPVVAFVFGAERPV